MLRFGFWNVEYNKVWTFLYDIHLSEPSLESLQRLYVKKIVQVITSLANTHKKLTDAKKITIGKLVKLHDYSPNGVIIFSCMEKVQHWQKNCFGFLGAAIKK